MKPPQAAPPGFVPWGYRRSADGKRLLRDPREQRVLAVVAHMRANGWTLREIAEELERLELYTRRGRPIGLPRVHEMVCAIETLPRYELYRDTLVPPGGESPRHYRHPEPAELARAVALHRKGLTVRAIAAKIGVPRATVHRALRRATAARSGA